MSRRLRILALVLAVLTVALAAAALVLRTRTPAGARALAEARERLATRDVDGAVRVGDLAWAALGESAEAATVSALARAAAGDLAAALERLETAARLAPDAPEPALAAGLVARRLARSAQPRDALVRRASRWFELAVLRSDALSARSADPHAARVAGACARLASGDAEDALRRAESLAPSTPERAAESAMVRAAALAALGRTSEARDALCDVAGSRAEEARARLAAADLAAAEPPLAAGMRAWRQGDLPVAAALLGRWAEERRWDPAAWAAYGRTLARLDRPADVATHLEALAAASPEGPAAAWFRGWNLLALGEPEAASAMLDVARARAPGELAIAAGVVDAGLARLAAANDTRALADFDGAESRTAASAPDDFVPVLLRGCAAEKRGDLRAAEAHYREALRLEPRCGVAANNLAWLLATGLGRVAEAAPLAEAAARLLPGSGRALDTRGWVRHLGGDSAGGATDLAAARRIRPRDGGTSLRHARVLLAVDRPAEARDALRSALVLDPGLREDPAFRDAAAAAGLERSP